MTRVLSYDTVVIGGGQAGLAVGHHLADRDVDFVILDGAARVGDSWRHRWDSLRLFTPARYDGLPGMPFPDAPGHFPDKDQVADYLERYAERFDLPVRTGTRVSALRRVGPDFVLDTTLDGRSARFTARSVVVATGPFQRPRVPPLAKRLHADVHQLHSHAYRNPFELPEGNVLVVGAGNSGAQIALELSASRTVTLAGRDVPRLPRTVLGADVFRWIWPAFRRLHLGTRLGRRLRARTSAGDPLIGISPRDFASHGIRRVGRVTDVRDGRPYAGDVEVGARVVVWATGYASDFGWIDVPRAFGSGGTGARGGPGDDAGRGVPAHVRGVSPVEGLYFVGLRFQHRQSSALLGGVGEDAAFIASLVASRMGADGAQASDAAG